MMKYHRTFAVFTLVPSLTGSNPPTPNTYIPPLMPCGTQYHAVECGPPVVVRWVGGGGWHDEGQNDLPLDV